MRNHFRPSRGGKVASSNFNKMKSNMPDSPFIKPMQIALQYNVSLLMTLHDAKQQLTFQLMEIYEDNEAAAIADTAMEHITGWQRIDRVMNKTTPLPDDKQKELADITKRLLLHEPVQYITGHTWFAGMQFFVNTDVLIPRPETDELVAWAIADTLNKNYPEPAKLNIFDIGTGSGCIAIAMKKKIPEATVWATDISEDAIKVAEKNKAANLLPGQQINFLNFDFLYRRSWHFLGKHDVIISNPPYIPEKDKDTMRPNVLNYEPHRALFVPSPFALTFYDAIASFAAEHLTEQGAVFLETHEKHAKDVADLFTKSGFTNIEIKKDMQGKERMVRAAK
jgi:release factor glutamine methyltransferase